MVHIVYLSTVCENVTRCRATICLKATLNNTTHTHL